MNNEIMLGLVSTLIVTATGGACVWASRARETLSDRDIEMQQVPSRTPPTAIVVENVFPVAGQELRGVIIE